MENEKRLIDANALMDEFRKYMVERHDRERCASKENCETCCFECLWRRVIKRAPTVDAVEIMHGRWEWVYRGQGVCSNCRRLDNIDIYATHCRYCGAKMDGGIDNPRTAESVAVVRCKDCVFYTKDTKQCKVCSFIDEDTIMLWYPNDFCSYGKRRTEDG